MGIDLSAVDMMLPKAIRHFWKVQRHATCGQGAGESAEHGKRAGPTVDRALAGVIAMVRKLIGSNGISKADAYYGEDEEVTLPGFFRSKKKWDLVVVSKGVLITAIEFRSQVGPVFGDDLSDQMAGELLVNAKDLNAVFREGALGQSAKPFVGYFFVLEECPQSTRPVKFFSPHFPAMPEFVNASYAARYEILCRKLVQEQLYDAAALVLTQASAARTGACSAVSELTSPHQFAAALAGKIAAASAG